VRIRAAPRAGNQKAASLLVPARRPALPRSIPPAADGRERTQCAGQDALLHRTAGASFRRFWCRPPRDRSARAQPLAGAKWSRRAEYPAEPRRRCPWDQREAARRTTACPRAQPTLARRWKTAARVLVSTQAQARPARRTSASLLAWADSAWPRPVLAQLAAQLSSADLVWPPPVREQLAAELSAAPAPVWAWR
jgi:hypothetical protein